MGDPKAPQGTGMPVERKGPPGFLPPQLPVDALPPSFANAMVAAAGARQLARGAAGAKSPAAGDLAKPAVTAPALMGETGAR